MAKKPVSYKVDEEVLTKFNKLSKENALNRSLWLQIKMKEYTDKNKNAQ